MYRLLNRRGEQEFCGHGEDSVFVPRILSFHFLEGSVGRSFSGCGGDLFYRSGRMDSKKTLQLKYVNSNMRTKRALPRRMK